MIYLVSPDNESVHGGIKIINQHASLLAQHGHEVKLADPNGKVSTWMKNPFADVVDYQIVERAREGDIVVTYWNGHRDIDVAFKSSAKRFFVSLNTQPPSVLDDYPVEVAVENDMVGEAVFTKEWDGFLCTTSYLRDICKEYGKEASLITVGVDTSLFAPGDKESGTVAFFPRRGDFVVNNREFIEKLGLVLVPIQDQPEEGVANILSRSEFFLSITTGLFFNCKSLEGKPRPAMEGWNMPVHEAMACGCAVIGYKAYASPFMEEGTAWVAQDCDEEHFRQKIQECLSADRKGVVAKSVEEAGRYSMEMMYETFAKGIGVWQPK
jgi:hypothetical protein